MSAISFTLTGFSIEQDFLHGSDEFVYLGHALGDLLLRLWGFLWCLTDFHLLTLLNLRLEGECLPSAIDVQVDLSFANKIVGICCA